MLFIYYGCLNKYFFKSTGLYIQMSDSSNSSNSPIAKRSHITDMPSQIYESNKIDVDKNLFPHSIVWTPIPVLRYLATIQ